jgi:AraC-like DNA-binding protein
MHQHFERYLCKTPAEFRKVIRFRKAVNAHRLLPAEQGLTRLSLLANYFDQSHMIRDFKELTGHTPKSFFRSISRLGDWTNSSKRVRSYSSTLLHGLS